jgi:putative ABC transport system substrate-binding protein
MMRRRAFVSGTLAFLAAPLAAEAQRPGKIARIGFLSLSAGPTPTMDLSPGLRELGWIEGQNIAIEYRWAAGRHDQLPALAAELVRLKVDITSSTLAAHCSAVGNEGTKTEPGRGAE